jgi:phosphoribosylamine---glycine ligase
MNVLLIGSGGREHALAVALSESPLPSQLFCAPGNAGIADVCTCVTLAVTNHQAVIDFCREKKIEFVVIGPEAPLVAGLADDLSAAGIKHFGPSAAAAQLEGSKGFTKDLCCDVGIPTAAYGRFNSAESAKTFARKQSLPVVIKADGLAAGKGVTIAQSQHEAEAAIDHCFSGVFGAAGAEVVVEDFMPGEEASFFALCDGTTAIPFATAQDHKRVGDGDTGPNTGGMGAYSPAPMITDALSDRIMSEIIHPTVTAMAERGTPFKGVLFAGLMITPAGPKLIEYNVRFGDPETQVILARLRSDLLTALLAAAEGKLGSLAVKWGDDVALTVVMAADGYPGTPQKGTEIRGVDAASRVENVQIFHAGTRRDGPLLIADGGRVLCVTARGATVAEAQAHAYAAVAAIDWPEGFCRKDIGWRAILRDKSKA